MRLGQIIITGIVSLLYAIHAEKKYQEALKYHRKWMRSESARLPILQEIQPILSCVLISFSASCLWQLLYSFVLFTQRRDQPPGHG